MGFSSKEAKPSTTFSKEELPGGGNRQATFGTARFGSARFGQSGAGIEWDKGTKATTSYSKEAKP